MFGDLVKLLKNRLASIFEAPTQPKNMGNFSLGEASAISVSEVQENANEANSSHETQQTSVNHVEPVSVFPFQATEHIESTLFIET